jgi:hypothetical protein
MKESCACRGVDESGEMNPARALMSRVRALVAGQDSVAHGMAAPSADGRPAHQPAAQVLAQGLALDAWVDYADGEAVIPDRRITIRTILGERAADGCAMPTQLRAWCHSEEHLRLFDIGRIQALRATRTGAALRRAEDIGMWLRVESRLLHARDVERLNTLRRRAQDEVEATPAEPGAARRFVRPIPVRVETTRDDEPLARRIEDLFLLSWDAGPGGSPVVIYVAKDPEARRGRAVRIAPGGAAPNKLLMLQTPPGGAQVLDVPRWVAQLPARG